ncbi:MAG: dihydrofolate reductase family protein [Mycobacteriales bacterium]
MSTDRRIVANFFVSLDGVVESPDKWHFRYFDDQMGQAVGAGMASADALLMGGTLYREWSEYWPAHADDDFGGFMNGITKYVVSRTLDRADWTNTTLIRDDVAARIRELKAQPGKDIAMSGSATLARWLLAEGLLDELNLLVHPIVVGTGARLFPDGTAQQPLKLASSTAFGSGVLHLVYRPTPA